MTLAMPANEQPRWGHSLCLVLGAHAVLILAVLGWSWQTSVPPTPQAPEAVMVELAPLPSAPPAPPTELAPGPLQQQQEPRPQQAVVAPITPEIPPLPDRAAEVALPQARPEPREQAQASTASPEVTQSTAPPSVQAPRSDRYAARQSSSGATDPAQANWQAQVLAHLEGFKRYPRAAQRRRSEGVSLVEYAVDRAGSVQWARLARSSGNTALDGEAVAAVQRASPLPAPPDEVHGDPVNITTPVEFFIR